MENTEKVLFEDDRPQWYIALGDRWVGPVAASDVYERVVLQKITWAHFIWKQGQKEWMRLCDVKMFAAAVPGQPAKNLQREVKEVSREISRGVNRGTQNPVVKMATTRKAESSSGKPVVASVDERGWFLYYNETQFGPFTKDEVIRFLNVGKITPRVHAWRGGLATWTRIEAIESFKVAVSDLKPEAQSNATSKVKAKDTAKERAEQRRAPRRPLVAKILLSNSKDVLDAVCRDISVGGMQVLTDSIPGVVGEKIKLNVSATEVESFVAEGVIVRLLEDQKGFSFRFDRLSEPAKRSIEQYIKSPQ